MAAVLLYRRQCEDAGARNLTDHRALAWNRPGGIRGAEIIGERRHLTGSPWGHEDAARHPYPSEPRGQRRYVLIGDTDRRRCGHVQD